MNTRFKLAILGGLAVGWALSRVSVPQPAQSQEVKNADDTQPDAELEGLKATAGEFEKAFNAGDAKAIAALFMENAEAVDEDDHLLNGRDKIEGRFAELFKDFPKAKIKVELTSLRKLTPNVAVEDGFSTTTLDPDEPGARSPYTIVHVKRNDKWLIASVRDFPEEGADETAHAQLKALEWLLGHWVDESLEGRVETTCQWSDDGNFLLQDFVVKTRRDSVMQGTQRIGWDPRQRTVRSWAFDDSGAFTEATWTPLEDGWIVKTEGVTPDGRRVCVTRFVTQVGEDAYEIDSRNLVVGNEMFPDSAVRVMRVPPEPGQ